MDAPTDVSAWDTYKITIMKEQAAFMLNGTPRTTADGIEVISTYQTTVKRTSEFFTMTLGEEPVAARRAIGVLEVFRAQTAQYYGMPDERVHLLHDIAGVGEYDWEMIYMTNAKELETGEVPTEEEAVYDRGVVICCGDVVIEHVPTSLKDICTTD